jgi:hypothetical protein
MVIEVSRRLQNVTPALVGKRGLTIAGELRPGDAGLAAEAPPAVLGHFGAERIGVDCRQGLTLPPRRSASVVCGAGRDLSTTNRSRCDDCRRRAPIASHS